MRLVPLLLVLLTLTSSLYSQQQEQKLMDRLDRSPQKDQGLVFDTRQASFSGGRSFSAKSANSKSFFFTQKVSPGEYRSKDYSGAKSAWMGDFKFSTRQANTRGKFEVPNAGRQVNTKTMAVADARESAKGMPTREYAKGNRPYLGKEADKMKTGHAPNQQPAGWTGNLDVMTIDDIRDLLNKNE